MKKKIMELVDMYADFRKDEHRAAIEAALPDVPTVLEGWKLVPIEPTIEMRDAGIKGGEEAYIQHIDNAIAGGPTPQYGTSAEAIYAAMLSAAPEPAQAEQPCNEPVPHKLPNTPGMADMTDQCFVDGWNACCDAFFGGKPAIEPVVITITEKLEQARQQMESQKDEWLAWEAKRKDIENDAARWREWRKGKSLTVDIPTPAEEKPNRKTTVIFGPHPEPGYGKALDASVDAAIKESK